MAQIPYRANLSAAIFPMTIARAGRSVIVPGIDQNFNRSIDSPDDSNRDAGIPQIIYGENVIPTADGYQSVGYTNGGTIGPVAPSVSWVPVKLNVPGSGRKHILILIGAGITKSTVNGVTFNTDTITGTAPVGASNFVSTATVRGICYLHVGARIYTVTGNSPLTLTEVTASFTPAGILTNLIGICGSYTYLVLLKSDATVNWSSTTTPTDFTPSLVSGAGSGALTGNAGAPQYIKPSPTGFYIYCWGNVVNAQYTGNARYPWKFVPVEDSEGVVTDSQIAGEPTDSIAFIASNSGTLMQITPRNATLIAQEVSELLSRIRYKDIFDYTNNTFSVTSVTSPLDISLAYLMSRYIVMSRDNVGYLYDTEFKRYGKFNVTHQYVTDLDPLSPSDSRPLVFFDLVNGTCKILNTNVNDSSITSNGVILLGKFQYVRSRFICLDEVSIECTQLSSLVPADSRNFEAYAIPTLDGKTFEPAVPLVPLTNSSTSEVVTYPCNTDSKNVSILIKGAFDLSSVDMLFHPGGSV